MANTILTPTAVTREALRVLHQKLKFVGSINRQYDDSYARSGAKIGDSLKIRLPNQFTIRSGATLSAQDVTESSVTLQLATQKGVDVNFTSAELTLSLDDFSARILKPAMAVLAANIEADALAMVKDVYNFIDGDAAAPTFLQLLQAKQKLDENLAPEGEDRSVQLIPTHSAKIIDALKGLFNDQRALGQQYKDGVLGKTADFDFYQNTLLPSSQATGTSAKTTVYLSNGVAQTGASIAVDTGANTFKKGDVITFAGTNAAHAETKADLGYLQQFVLTADYAGGAGSVAIDPAVTATGAKQNVTAAIADNSAVVKVGAGASETYVQSLLYHKDAFAIAFADLLDVSEFGAWGARQVMDGISMRIARQYDITNDKFPCRIDVFYGFKAIRPQLACRLHADG